MTAVSFEFFPPKTVAASFRLHEAVQALAPYRPDFVSVTYGAGGSTRKLTRQAAVAIHRAGDLQVAAHLTCVDATREETLAVADGFAEAGIDEIVALRGDPPEGQRRFEPHPGGFADSCELISALAGTGRFRIRVGAYPERHPEAADNRADIDWLKRKIDAGAHSAITQFFFEAEAFLRFRDRCQAAGIEAQIIPGILPIEDFDKTVGFASRCGARIPDWMHEHYRCANRDGRADLLSIAITSELCSDLIDEGVGHLHFYTLNTPDLTARVCQALGMQPEPIRQVA